MSFNVVAVLIVVVLVLVVVVIVVVVIVVVLVVVLVVLHYSCYLAEASMESSGNQARSRTSRE